MKQILVLLFILGIPGMGIYALSAQNAINQNWYFGDAGLDFSTTPPTLLLNSGMNALTGATEGSASISDTAGNILFYTEGDTVYNKNHQAMPNGFDLEGGFSTAQPASIVQWPGVDDRYAVFTSHGSTMQGSYSVVDMSLQGGLGDISNKNVFITDSVMEALLVVPHRECGKYWIIYKMADSNRFETYLFDVDGLHPTPVVSFAGNPAPPNAHVAYLSSSNDYSTLVFSCIYDTAFSILHFDNATGEISDFVTVNLELAYASCFSPDNRLLYVSHARWSEGTIPPASNFISQYDLSSGQQAGIAASRFTVDSLQSDLNGEFGQMRVGTDGVMYTVRAWNDFLGTVQQPNEPGAACGYTREGFSIAPKHTWLGLPAIAYGNTASIKPDLGPDLHACQGPVSLKPQKPVAGPYQWNTGSTDAGISVGQSGTYILTLNGCGNSLSDTVEVTLQNTGSAWTVPNIFTPNHDGLNDIISPLLNTCEESDFRIYNRWGNLVYTYSADSPTFVGETGTGSPLTPGVYFYVYTQGQQKNEGTITLVR